MEEIVKIYIDFIQSVNIFNLFNFKKILARLIVTPTFAWGPFKGPNPEVSRWHTWRLRTNFDTLTLLPFRNDPINDPRRVGLRVKFIFPVRNTRDLLPNDFWGLSRKFPKFYGNF